MRRVSAILIIVALVLPALWTAVPPASAQNITEYPVPSPVGLFDPLYIAAGSDGALWFTEFTAGKIGRATTPAGTPSPTPLPTSVTLVLIGLAGLALLEILRRRRSAA